MTPVPRLPRRPGALATVPLALALLLGGCAAQRAHRAGLADLAEGRTVQGVEQLRKAASLAPDDLLYRKDYLARREEAVDRLLAQAEQEREAGRPEAAAQRARDALKLDAGSDRARALLRGLDARARAEAALDLARRFALARQFEPAQEQLRRALLEVPRHADALALQQQLEAQQESERAAREEALGARAAFRRPVTLQFRDAPLRMVFEALSRVGNVNVIVDREVKADLRTTIFVKDASIEDAIDVILLQNQLEKRVISSNTLMIYPATATRVKELAELKVRTFQLVNVDAAFMASVIKTMAKTRDVVTDPKTNTLVMRDTPEAVSLAERLVAAHDLPDPEVMLEVEVLEISSTRASEIGLKLPTSLSVSTPVPEGGLTLGGLRALTRNDLSVNPLSATLNLMLRDGDANVLASPRIRTRHKEKARILVGDKLPIITNMLAPQTSGQNTVVTGSVQYVEVGIKLEVEPHVYADGDVGIKLNLEVSNVTDTVQSESGRAYQIGTRNAQTSLRLRDGETQVLGGLINDADRNSALKVPGLGQIPLVGRLFSNETGDHRKTEIVLSITPRIVRPQAQAAARDADLWSGTDTGIRDRALRLEPVGVVKAGGAGSTAAPGAGRAALPAPAAAPAAPAGTTAPAAPGDAAASPAASAAPGPAATPAPAGLPGLPAVQARPLPGRTPAAPPAAPVATPSAPPPAASAP